MRPTVLPPALARFVSFLLAYSLLVTLLGALPTRRAVASSEVKAPVEKVAGTRAAARPRAQAARRDNELLVRFREGVGEQEQNALLSSKGARRKAKLRGRSRLEKLELQAGQDPSAVAAELSRQPSVEFAEPNFVITRSQVAPDDARFAEQWALRNVGQTGGQSGADIASPAAWASSVGGAATVVAVVDSGVDFMHPDLAGNRWTNGRERDNRRDDDRNGFADDLYGWDWVTNSGVIRDAQGHGTAVAGIIAAQGNNGVGVSGVMWRASLMSLRVLDETGAGDVASAVEAIDYAAEMGAGVINCSWGTEGESLALRDAIERAGALGAVVVASAGNGGLDVDARPYYPSSFDLPNLVSVAATDQFDNLASWSNWGASRVAVAAPGVDILTTKMGGDYRVVSGTSAAAPLVSGIAGLVKTERAWETAAGVRQAIVEGARRVASLEGKVAAGGVASAAGALGALSDPYARGRGNGNGDDNGNGRQVRQTPRPAAPGHGGRGGEDFRNAPPEPTTEALQGFPNLDEIRGPQAAGQVSGPPIRSNLLPMCDLNCGGSEPPPGGGSDPDFSTPRTQPENETGQPREDLGSRNYNWDLQLVGLRGRNGLDLNVTLFYNSLVWTKQGSTVRFNTDHGFPGPGFSLGFPKLQQRFFNSLESAYSYLLVTPSGGHVELKQTGTANIYEAEDGSYTQLDTNTMLVRTSDGTQMRFVASVNNEFRCDQIKDRNGNYISVSYNSLGRPTSAVDTLGRTVSFVYDSNNYLTRISQTWNRETASGVVTEQHDWARFYFDQITVQTDFRNSAGSPLSVQGPANGTAIPVLKEVWLPDNSRYVFNYTSWGQVYQTVYVAPDGHTLSWVGYNLPGSPWLGTSAQQDCPRFTERRDWIQMGVMNQDAEVITRFATAADNSWSTVTAPDNTVYKEYFATSGWQRGLTTRNEVYAANDLVNPRRWTVLSWTQDNTSLTFQKNPRPAEVNTYDAEGNRRRVAYQYTSYSLPSVIGLYGGPTGQTLLHQTNIGYNFDAAYVNRRILGLISVQEEYDGNWGIVSKTIYSYDWGGEHLTDTAAAPTQHDPAYSAGFVLGRGNLVMVSRYDVVNDIHNANGTGTEQRYGYNKTGSLTFSRDHNGHQSSIGYADNFSNGGNRNTFAYATLMTDGDGFQSTTQYNYDMGLVTRVQDPKGASLSSRYDGVGRIERTTNNVNGAFTHYVYAASGLWVQTQTTVNSTTQLAFAEQHFDGVGRVRATSASFPGSVGGSRATHVMYDAMGRVVQAAHPIEITGGWAAAGDDATGWKWTYQQYDWQGRPTLMTKEDGYTKLIEYGGCGCAGVEVTTVRDERGRRRKLYKDELGRLSKVEDLDWNGNVYSTAKYAYNGRDQLTSMRLYQGTEASGVYQQRSMTFDGLGRLASRTTPEQGTTTYAYNRDGTLNKMTDARGATTTLGYNGRHKITSVTYGVAPGYTQTWADSPNVTFGYDEAGNRTSMTETDKFGVLRGKSTYHYDQLSRMDWEQRHFPEFGAAPAGTFTTSYAYNLAGDLTTVTNPWGSNFGYTRDFSGQVTSVTGGGPVSFNTYAFNIGYRAWGGLKQMTYNNSRQLNVSYDNLMRVTRWNVQNVMGWDYNYDYFNEHTGRVTYARNLYDSRLDRSYDYDHVGRLTIAYTGMDARAHVGIPGSSWGVQDGPYASPNFYDVYGNITSRQGWGGANPWFSATYTNNRRNGFGYDAAGNLTFDGGQNFTYDATGQQATASYSGYSLTNGYDGDGLRVKKTENGVVTYYLRSSVLGGQVLAEVNSGGGWSRGYVYDGNGNLLALQQNGSVRWVHQDPITKSQRLTDSIGGLAAAIDLDPWGGETGAPWNQNTSQQPRKFTTYERDGNQSDDAMARRYNRWHSRFDQPDPYDGSYDLTNPQSFNRYAYVANDPVNFIDPSGLLRVCYYSVVGYITFNFDTPRQQTYAILRLDFCIDFPDMPFREPLGPGGGRGRNPRASLDQIKKALDECLQEMFGVKLTSFTPSEKGKGGGATLNFTDPSRRLNGFQGFGVINDVTTYTAAQLGKLDDTFRGSATPGGPALGLGGGRGTRNGVTYDPHVTYTASNRGSYNAKYMGLQSLVGKYIDTQIHELGNAVATLTGTEKGDPNSKIDKDSGHALSLCVVKKLKGGK